jgi:hypothetical protein
VLDWENLSIRNRFIGSFFVLFALVATLAPLFMTRPDIQALLGGAFVGCSMLCVVLNPASFKGAVELFYWQSMPPLCKLLACGAGLALVLRGVAGLLA